MLKLLLIIGLLLSNMVFEMAFWLPLKPLTIAVKVAKYVSFYMAPVPVVVEEDFQGDPESAFPWDDGKYGKELI